MQTQNEFEEYNWRVIEVLQITLWYFFGEEGMEKTTYFFYLEDKIHYLVEITKEDFFKVYP